MVNYLTVQELENFVNSNRKILIAHDLVYDITNYFSSHPGGNCILNNIIKIENNRIIIKQSNMDFDYHSKKSKKIWKKLLIGTIKKPSRFQKLLNLLF